MNQPEYTVAESEKISPQWDLSRITFQMLTDLEVDLVVLSRELSTLVDTSTKIIASIRELRLSQQDTE